MARSSSSLSVERARRVQVLGPAVQQEPVAELVYMAAGQLDDQPVPDPNLRIRDVQPHIVAVAPERRPLHPPPRLAPHLAVLEPAGRRLRHRDALAVGQIGVVGDQRADLHEVEVGILPAREQLRAALAGLVGEIHLPAHQARGERSLELRMEAAETLRSLIDEIKLIPTDSALMIELVGALASILALGQSKRPQAGT